MMNHFTTWLGVALLGTAGLPVRGHSSESPTAMPKRAAVAKPDLSLLLIEDVVTKDGMIGVRDLVRYRFRDGRVLGKERLLSREQRFFGHFGGHHLVNGRYVVTKFGGVFDLRAGRLIHDEDNGDYLGHEADRILVRVNNAFRENGVFAFDLTTNRAAKLARPGRWGLRGEPCPWRPVSVYSPPNSATLSLTHADGKLELLGDGFGVQVSPRSAFIVMIPPVLWLDAHRVLTQQGNGKLVALDTRTKKVELVVDIPLSRPTGPIVILQAADMKAAPWLKGINEGDLPLNSPRLYRDPDGNVVYDCVQEYLIDVGRKTFAPRFWQALGHGFDCEARENVNHGRIVRYRGAEIGRLWCQPSGAVTAEGHLAVPYHRAGGPRSFPAGAWVWSARTRGWTDLRVGLNSLVGWAP